MMVTLASAGTQMVKSALSSWVGAYEEFAPGIAGTSPGRSPEGDLVAGGAAGGAIVGLLSGAVVGVGGGVNPVGACGAGITGLASGAFAGAGVGMPAPGAGAVGVNDEPGTTVPAGSPQHPAV